MLTHILDGHLRISKNGKSFWCVKHQKNNKHGYFDLVWHIQLTTRFKFTILERSATSFKHDHCLHILLQMHCFFVGIRPTPKTQCFRFTTGPCCGLDGILLCIGDVWIDGQHTWLIVVDFGARDSEISEFSKDGVTGCLDVRSKHATKISHGSSKWMQIYSIYTGSRPKMPETRWKT